MRTTGVARGAHAQLAGRIGGEEIALHLARAEDLAPLGAHAFVIERRAALAAHNERIVQDVQVFGHDPLAQAVAQKRGLAVERTTAGGLHIGAQQAGRQRRFEQHRAFGGGDLAAVQARQRSLRGITPHSLGAGKVGG